MKKGIRRVLKAIVTIVFLAPLPLLAQGTAFTYQGRLNQNGSPYTGTAEFLASLWSVPVSGSVIISNLPGSVVVGVSNGLFTLPLDFGANFTGGDRWLELDVRTGLGTFTQLAPRQQLTPSPYAVYAGNVSAAGISGAIADAQLSTNIARLNSSNLVFSGQVQFNNTNSAFHGSFSGNGSGITNVPLNALNSYGMITWGNFASATPLPALTNPGFVITADVNGDGRQDIVSANSGNSSLSIYTNNGNGGFVLSSSPTVGGNPVWLMSADVNGDGKPDLITADYGSGGDGNTLTIMTNNGSGGFVLMQSPTVGHGPVAVTAGDFNNDGLVDLAVANYTDSSVTILLQGSNGLFFPLPVLNPGGHPVSVIATNLMALDGSTNVDLICVLDSIGINIQLYGNNGSGFFSPFAGRFSGNNPYFAAAADLNGDGVPEVITADASTGNLSIYNFIGNTTTLLPVPGLPTAVTIADIDGDGHPDLLTPNGNGTVSIFLNNGSGGFTPAPSLTAGTDAFSVAAADLNGDGKIDLTTANFFDNNLSLLLNAPHITGGFTGDGSGLTGLNASNFVSGTLSDARLSANVALLSADQTFAGQNTFNNPANSFTGNGSGLTSLNASNIAVGILTDARLSTNVARLNANQTFSGANTFNGQIALNSPNGFAMSSAGAFNIDAPFISGGRLTVLTNGNVGIGVPSPVVSLDVKYVAHVQGSNNWDVTGTEGDFRVGNDSTRFKIGVATSGGGAGDVWMRAHGGTARVFLKTPGGTTIYSNEGQSAGVSLAANGTAWAVVSDRNAKKDFSPIDSREILEKLATMPITQWHYKWEEESVTPHMGPMAQDFKAAFYPGTDDKSITTQEADGVAFAAIQGLNKKVESENAALRAENAELKNRLERLERLIGSK